jgi:hypothetical protein
MATKQVTLRTLKGEPGVDPRQTYFYTGSDGSIYLHVTKSTKVDPTQPSENIRMTQSDGVTPYGNIIDFGRNAASWIYGDDTNRQILTQNLPQFENILNANPTFTPFNKKLKEDELWDVKYEAPKEDLLEEFKKETFEDSMLYYNTGNIKGAELLNLTLEKYGIKAVPKGWYGIDIKDKDDNLLESISVDKDKGDRENYFKLLKGAVEKNLRKQQPQQQQTPKTTTKPAPER